LKASSLSKPSEANWLLTDRAHRIGQEQPVFAYKLLVEGSFEERMLALQERKRRWPMSCWSTTSKLPRRSAKKT
jgi:hypothetical protein